MKAWIDGSFSDALDKEKEEKNKGEAEKLQYLYYTAIQKRKL